MAKVVSCEIRASFVSVFSPRANRLDPTEAPKYGMQILVPKNDDGKKFLKDLRDAYTIAVQEKWPNGAPPNVREFMGDERMKPCVRDGDKKVNDQGQPVGGEYGEHWYLNANNKKRPGLIDSQNRRPIVNEEDFQSGDYAYVQLSVYAYAVKGNMGVAFGLENVMMSRKGEPLTGRDNPEDAFAVVPASASAGVAFDDIDPLGEAGAQSTDLAEDPLA